MNRLFYLIAFFSGVAALGFETLWFRQTSLVFGSTIWAATAVLSAFMSGLALGNLISLRLTEHRSPLRIYAAVEVFIAIISAALVWLLPALSGFVAPWFAPLIEQPVILHGLRFLLAFLLMLLPAIAMGITLPILLKASGQIRDPSSDTANYTKRLGLLYATNICGAITGILISEFLLVGGIGIRSTAITLSCAALIAALLAVMIRKVNSVNVSYSDIPDDGGNDRLLMLCAALCGSILLGLEVVWFRLLLLHHAGTGETFAIMLAVVLAGISMGSAIASRLRWNPAKQVSVTALIAAMATTLLFVALSPQRLSNWPIAVSAAALIFIPALLSGALFTQIGSGLRQCLNDLRSTAWLAGCNTAGAAAGAALTALWLLPSVGPANALVILSSTYLLVSLLAVFSCHKNGISAFFTVTTLACCLMAIPLLIMSNADQQLRHHLNHASLKYRLLDQQQAGYSSREVSYSHAADQTIQLLRRDFLGQPVAWRLMTDGYSMSGTEVDSRRYMSLFAWLPAAIHPSVEDVLLISYGLGTTAQAILDVPELQSLTVIDSSREVLNTSLMLHNDPKNSPLADPRTTWHIEDGRHFLQMSGRRFDLITGEPPPPRMRGVVNLYTQEYFSLIHQHLNPGGRVSYWLPIDQMDASSATAILKAFCNTFPDCSLWAGSHYNLIMLGSKASNIGQTANTRVSDAHFSRLWQGSSGLSLAELGLEYPAQLGASFIADATTLNQWIVNAQPLNDNHPKRLTLHSAYDQDLKRYADWMDNEAARQRFSESVFIRQYWPDEIRRNSLPQFAWQPILNGQIPPDSAAALRIADDLSQMTRLTTPILWLMASGIQQQSIASTTTSNSPVKQLHMGIGLLALRKYEPASHHLALAMQGGLQQAAPLLTYAYCRSNQQDTAKALVASLNNMNSKFGQNMMFACQ